MAIAIEKKAYMKRVNKRENRMVFTAAEEREVAS